MNAAIAAGAILVVSSIFVILGLGGGILFVPILYWAGYDLQTVAIPLGLLLNGLNTLLALIPYGRAGLVDWNGGWPMALMAALTAPMGALVQPHMAAGLVLTLFAGAVTVAALLALRSARGGTSQPAAGRAVGEPLVSARIGIRVVSGAIVGFVGGFLGIGAGFIVVPTFLALGYSPKQTAATTALVVTVCSFAGFAGYTPHLDLPFYAMILAGIAVVAGSQIGARLMLRGAKPAWITGGQVVVLMGVALKLVWEAVAAI
ncbi:MAG: sulfite exporter TauE/SafE family protein [Rhodospirillales bacterium]|nr:sulfite exporter TauE/SafE family protein [Rhodospirillales bacterium]